MPICGGPGERAATLKGQRGEPIRGEEPDSLQWAKEKVAGAFCKDIDVKYSGEL